MENNHAETANDKSRRPTAAGTAADAEAVATPTPKGRQEVAAASRRSSRPHAPAKRSQAIQGGGGCGGQRGCGGDGSQEALAKRLPVRVLLGLLHSAVSPA